jgi:hypothetical protein
MSVAECRLCSSPGEVRRQARGHCGIGPAAPPCGGRARRCGREDVARHRAGSARRRGALRGRAVACAKPARAGGALSGALSRDAVPHGNVGDGRARNRAAGERFDAIVCRCEDVSLGAVQSAHSTRQAKLYTRAGMGPCQGRMCHPGLEFLLGWAPDTVRSPVEPVRVSVLSSEIADTATVSFLSSTSAGVPHR